mmetsp:Transcript_28245/g.72054  ORF Transcript_28245/g.72054 Transcript_28245/m.72054 type:complete len:80 (-) Transcript_28245:428-667(-)
MVEARLMSMRVDREVEATSIARLPLLESERQTGIAGRKGRKERMDLGRPIRVPPYFVRLIENKASRWGVRSERGLLDSG